MNMQQLADYVVDLIWYKFRVETNVFIDDENLIIMINWTTNIYHTLNINYYQYYIEIIYESEDDFISITSDFNHIYEDVKNLINRLRPNMLY